MKVTISRLFELSKYIATDAGKDLEGALSYLSDFAELTIRGLRNGLTFEDNLQCEKKTLSIRNNVETVILPAGKKRPIRILLDKVTSPYYIVNGFGWRFNTKGETTLIIQVAGSPPTTEQISLDVTIFYAS